MVTILKREVGRAIGGEPVSTSDLLDGRHAAIVRDIVVTAATSGNHGRALAWGVRGFLYEINFSDAEWFQAVAAGNFTTRMPFTASGNDVSDGTYIENLRVDPHVVSAYPNDDGLSLGFSAPVYENGEVVAYWSNRTRFSLVEDIFKTGYLEMKSMGYPGTELTLMDKDGQVIIDYDPVRTGSETIVHDMAVIGKLNLAAAGVEVAMKAVGGETGNGWSFHARKEIVQAAGFAHLRGALGYPGMNWSVLARAPRVEVAADILSTRRTIFSAAAVALIVIVLVGIIIGRKAVKPLAAMAEAAGRIAAGNLDQEPLAMHSKDEVGALASNFNEMLVNLQQLAEQARVMANDDLDNEVLANHVIGDLGDAFVSMVERMKWVAGQAGYIAAGDLYNEDLSTEAKGSLGTSMATMIGNLREQDQERSRLEQEVEKRASEAQARSVDAEVKRQQVLTVAEKVAGASGTVSSSAEQLSETTDQLANGSEKQRHIVEGVAAAVQQMAASARSVSTNTDQLAQLVDDNSSALGELATSIVSVTQNSEQMSQTVIGNSSAIEELAASIQTQAQSARQANETAEQASNKAKEGADVVRQAIRGMDRIADRVRASSETIGNLGKSSEQISTIVAVINDIADQTNLLALNAAIEAARAGEQGRGFAVVADEVRKLAERTSLATQEIDEMISRIQDDTAVVVEAMGEGMREVETGTQLASRSGEALEQISHGTQEVNGLMSQLNQASAEQASTSDEIVRSTVEMTELVQQVANAMGEQTQAVDLVSQSADEMQQLVAGVSQSMNEQTNTSESISQSMEEVNQLVADSSNAVQEMAQSSMNLATQADDLKRLSAQFEGEDSTEG